MYEVLSNRKPNSNVIYPFQVGDVIEIESNYKRSNGTFPVEMRPEDYVLKVNGRAVTNTQFTKVDFDQTPTLFRKMDCRLKVGNIVLPHDMQHNRKAPYNGGPWFHYEYEGKKYSATKDVVWNCIKQQFDGWVIGNNEGHQVFVHNWLLEKR